MMVFCGTFIALTVFLVQILLLCSFGQRISSQYDLLSIRLYESKWPAIIHDKSSGKILCIFMYALNEEYVIVVGKLMPLVLTTFASVSLLTNKIGPLKIHSNLMIDEFLI